MKRICTLLLLTAFCFGWACDAPAAEAIAPKLGTKVSDFAMQDFRGATHKLSDLKDAKFVVVAFIGVDCPICRLYGRRLTELSDKYAAQGVKFLAVDPNRQDAVTRMGHFAQEFKIEFPFLKDLNNKLADEMGATRVPQVFVLDGERIIRYAGRIDDEFGFETGSGYIKTRMNSPDLCNAIDELLAGKPLTKAIVATEGRGCLIGRVTTPDEKSEVTYSNQIARIFNEHCVECHRPGQIGPFALQSYEDAAGWAEMIAEVVRERRMPPWHVDPGVGHWQNDPSLTEAQKQDIFKWVAAGAPEGNPKDLPTSKQYAESWSMPGGPDQVIYMGPEAVNVKATGVEAYRNYTVDTGFTEDKWMAACEVVPGNRAVVHHIIVYVIPPGGNGTTAMLGTRAHLWGYAPGTRDYRLPPGYAKLIPAGSKLMFQMHYTPNGTEQTDRSYIGLKFIEPSKVTHCVGTSTAGNMTFAIPPNDPNYKVESTASFRGDVELLSLFPHMHVRGKDFSYDLTYPDGRRETLFTTAHYDFNWQMSYLFADIKKLPAGTQMHCVAHFDNSADNPANPDPTKTVRFGEQTWDEMMLGWFDMAVPKDVDINSALGSGGLGGGRGRR